MTSARSTDEGSAQPTPAAVRAVLDGPRPDDFDLVPVVNPRLHAKADPKPSPGRVTRAWLRMHAEKGWVEADAAGNPVKGS